MAAVSGEAVTLLGLADAELALYIILVYMTDFVDKQQRLADEERQSQNQKSTAQAGIHDIIIVGNKI